jgi:hypothetical protein
MSDVTEATPSPEALPVSDESSAIDLIGNLLDPSPDTPQNDAPPVEATPDAEPQTEATEEAEAEPEAEVSASEEAGEEPDEIELPSSITDLAEALGVPVDDLLNIRAKVGDEELSLSELQRGHLRESDYTRKTQALAEERRAVDAANQQAQARIQARESKLADLETALQSQFDAGYSEDNLEAIAENYGYSSEEYARSKETAERQRMALDAVKQERDRTRQEATDTQTRAMAEFRGAQQKNLLSRRPNLAKPEELQTFEGGIKEYMAARGLSDEETTRFFATFDDRHLQIIEDAKAYRDMTTGKSKSNKLKTLPKITRPGQSKGLPGKADKQTKLRDRLRSGRGKPKASQESAALDFIANALEE